MSQTTSIGVTSEFNDGGGQVWDKAVFDQIAAIPNVEITALPSGPSGATSDDLAAHDILVVRKTGVPKSAFSNPQSIRTRLIARFGVGYDHIDVDSCTRLGISLTTTPEGVRRPVASSVVTLVLALSHRLREKDLLTRSGEWQAGRNLLGVGLENRVFASIGFGNIAREAFRLLRPFGMRYMANDPFASKQHALELGVELADFETTVQKADFLAVNCPLTLKTRHIINSDTFALMKPTAFLINTARGPLVNQDALVDALALGRIAGAGLDVFETEPASADNPLFQFDNLISAPHSLCWTDECARLTSEGVFQSISEFLSDRPLSYLVNRDVMRHVKA